MPPRSALHRVATALLALLYFAAWGEPVSLHPCPMHDGAGVVVAGAGHGGEHAGGAAVAAASPRRTVAITPGHAGHAAAPARASHGPDGHAPAGDAHLCQCLGSGCSAGAVVAPGAQMARWFVVVTRRADPPARAPLAAPPPARPAAPPAGDRPAHAGLSRPRTARP
jgi:hypothetical protein